MTATYTPIATTTLGSAQLLILSVQSAEVIQTLFSYSMALAPRELQV
jgi:hypothetical protein